MGTPDMAQTNRFRPPQTARTSASDRRTAWSTFAMRTTTRRASRPEKALSSVIACRGATMQRCSLQRPRRNGPASSRRAVERSFRTTPAICRRPTAARRAARAVRWAALAARRVREESEPQMPERTLARASFPSATPAQPTATAARETARSSLPPSRQHACRLGRTDGAHPGATRASRRGRVNPVRRASEIAGATQVSRACAPRRLRRETPRSPPGISGGEPACGAAPRRRAAGTAVSATCDIATPCGSC